MLTITNSTALHGYMSYHTINIMMYTSITIFRSNKSLASTVIDRYSLFKQVFNMATIFTCVCSDSFYLKSWGKNSNLTCRLRYLQLSVYIQIVEERWGKAIIIKRHLRGFACRCLAATADLWYQAKFSIRTKKVNVKTSNHMIINSVIINTTCDSELTHKHAVVVTLTKKNNTC